MIAGVGYKNTDLNTARIAAKICLEIAEKAFIEGYYAVETLNEDEQALYNGATTGQFLKNKWLKENGII